jgi:hypothetical protein
MAELSEWRDAFIANGMDGFKRSRKRQYWQELSDVRPAGMEWIW